MFQAAYGFGEQITFSNHEGEELENFLPSSDYMDTDGIYEFEEEEKIVVEGMKIRVEFPFSDTLPRKNKRWRVFSFSSTILWSVS